MRRARRAQSINSSLQTAVGTILKPDRHGKATGHFAMGLAFGGASPNRRPRDKLRDVLRHDGIEKLCAHRQAKLIDVEQ